MSAVVERISPSDLAKEFKSKLYHGQAPPTIVKDIQDKINLLDLDIATLQVPITIRETPGEHEQDVHLVERRNKSAENLQTQKEMLEKLLDGGGGDGGGGGDYSDDFESESDGGDGGDDYSDDFESESDGGDDGGPRGGPRGGGASDSGSDYPDDFERESDGGSDYPDDFERESDGGGVDDFERESDGGGVDGEDGVDGGNEDGGGEDGGSEDNSDNRNVKLVVEHNKFEMSVSNKFRKLDRDNKNKIINNFNTYDIDGDGQISVGEFQQMTGLTDDEIKELIQPHDLNKDSNISRTEYLNWCMNTNAVERWDDQDTETYYGSALNMERLNAIVNKNIEEREYAERTGMSAEDSRANKKSASVEEIELPLSKSSTRPSELNPIRSAWGLKGRPKGRPKALKDIERARAFERAKRARDIERARAFERAKRARIQQLDNALENALENGINNARENDKLAKAAEAAKNKKQMDLRLKQTIKQSYLTKKRNQEEAILDTLVDDLQEIEDEDAETQRIFDTQQAARKQRAENIIIEQRLQAESLAKRAEAAKAKKKAKALYNFDIVENAETARPATSQLRTAWEQSVKLKKGEADANAKRAEAAKEERVVAVEEEQGEQKIETYKKETKKDDTPMPSTPSSKGLLVTPLQQGIILANSPSDTPAPTSTQKNLLLPPEIPNIGSSPESDDLQDVLEAVGMKAREDAIKQAQEMSQLSQASPSASPKRVRQFYFKDRWVTVTDISFTKNGWYYGMHNGKKIKVRGAINVRLILKPVISNDEIFSSPGTTGSTASLDTQKYSSPKNRTKLDFNSTSASPSVSQSLKPVTKFFYEDSWVTVTDISSTSNGWYYGMHGGEQIHVRGIDKVLVIDGDQQDDWNNDTNDSYQNNAGNTSSAKKKSSRSSSKKKSETRRRHRANRRKRQYRAFGEYQSPLGTSNIELRF